MEIMESVYQTVDTLGYPIVILEDTDQGWRVIYANSILKNMTLNDIDSSYNPIVVVLDTKGEVIDVNESFLHAVGEKKEDILHKSFFESFIPGDKKKLNGYLQALHSNDPHHQHFMTPLKGKNSKIYRIKWQVSTIKKADQSYIIAIGSDISKYVEENSELKRELTSIKVGFDFFPMAVGHMNAKGDFTTMNPKFMKFLNVPKSKEPINFQKIPLLKKHIDFKQMNEHIELIKEMHYTFEEEGKKYQVDIRMLRGSKENSKLYIFVIQKY